MTTPAGDAAGDHAGHVPESLRIDGAAVRERLVVFIRDQVARAGRDDLVLGLSGGVDSATVAFLAAEAVAPRRLHCLLLPDRTSAARSRTDAEAVAARLGCPFEVVDIAPIVDAFFADATDPGRLRRGNLAARVRMAILYDRSAALHGLVIGTGNKTESLLGYTTHHGDDACAFNPIGDLFKSQVRQLARVLGVPAAIVAKPPSADLWPGQTDEAELGLTYPVLDRLLQLLVDESRSVEAVVAEGFRRADAERVMAMVQASAFKRRLPAVARITVRRHAHSDHG